MLLFFSSRETIWREGRKTFQYWNIECGRVVRVNSIEIANRPEKEYGEKRARAWESKSFPEKLIRRERERESEIIVGKGKFIIFIAIGAEKSKHFP